MKQLLCACVFVVGCGSSNNSPNPSPDAASHSPDAMAIPLTNAVVGTVAGDSYVIQDAVSFADHSTDGTALIIMSTMPGICDRLAADTIDANERFVTITMSNSTQTSSSPPTSPGTFTVSTMSSANFGGVSTDVFDATCTHVDADSVDATSGTVQLDSVAGNVFTGTFDVSFSVTGDHITGSFSPTSCPNLVTVPTSPSACM
ncbi:MAG TPA: hypothetical protein VGG74_20405 [Kofleriaceae bacterium]|jgi:hypothetical protein